MYHRRPRAVIREQIDVKRPATPSQLRPGGGLKFSSRSVEQQERDAALGIIRVLENGVSALVGAKKKTRGWAIRLLAERVGVPPSRVETWLRYGIVDAERRAEVLNLIEQLDSELRVDPK